MKGMGGDTGNDLQVGDVVFVKFRVAEQPESTGDVVLQYLPRRGRREYARRSINAVFIKRPAWRWLQWAMNQVGGYL